MSVDVLFGADPDAQERLLLSFESSLAQRYQQLLSQVEGVASSHEVEEVEEDDDKKEMLSEREWKEDVESLKKKVEEEKESLKDIDLEAVCSLSRSLRHIDIASRFLNLSLSVHETTQRLHIHEERDEDDGESKGHERDLSSLFERFQLISHLHSLLAQLSSSLNEASEELGETAHLDLQLILQETVDSALGKMYKVVRSEIQKALSLFSWPLPGHHLKPPLDLDISFDIPSQSDPLSSIHTADQRLSRFDGLFLLFLHLFKLDPIKAQSSPVDLLMDLVYQRFEFHFLSNQPTNRLDKPEWYLTFATKLIKDQSDFLVCHLQALCEHAGISPATIDVRLQFMENTIKMISRRTKRDLQQIVESPKISFTVPSDIDETRVTLHRGPVFRHLVREIVQFDFALRDIYLYPSSCASLFDSIVQEPSHFQIWIAEEHEGIMNQLRSIHQHFEITHKPEFSFLVSKTNIKDEHCRPSASQMLMELLFHLSRRISLIHDEELIRVAISETIDFAFVQFCKMFRREEVVELFEKDPIRLDIVFVNALGFCKVLLEDWQTHLIPVPSSGPHPLSSSVLLLKDTLDHVLDSLSHNPIIESPFQRALDSLVQHLQNDQQQREDVRSFSEGLAVMHAYALKYFSDLGEGIKTPVLKKLGTNIETKVITIFESLVVDHWILSPLTALWLDSHLTHLQNAWSDLCQSLTGSSNLPLSQIKELSVMLKASASSLKQLKMDLYLSLEGAKANVLREFGLSTLSARQVEGFTKLRSDVN